MTRITLAAAAAAAAFVIAGCGGGGSVPTATGGAAPTVSVKQLDGIGAVLVDDHGHALYRFTQDPGPGKVTGDDFKDAFGGTAFTWHAVTTSGHTTSAPSNPRSGY
jgi:predicted lipoprotein with Yx(FWY)xxD motif